MKCPYCGHCKTKVLDKRDSETQNLTRRRRECLKCHKRFTTYERIERLSITVIKRDGHAELFDKEKLLRSILKSLPHNKNSQQKARNIADEIENKLINRKNTIVSTKEIGRMVLTRLKRIDTLAYLRYMSVYKQFKTIEDIKLAISKLEKKN